MIRNAGDIVGRVNRVIDNSDAVVVVVDTDAGERHVMFAANVFRNIWKTVRGNLVGRRVKVSGQPPVQKFEFVDVDGPKKKKKKMFRG